MSDPFIGEIRAFAFDYNTPGWTLCNGALQLISDNQALYAIIGTLYGGNGVSTFAVPNLVQGYANNTKAGRAIRGYGSVSGLTPGMIGETMGAEEVVLTESQIPAHTHEVTTYYGKVADLVDQPTQQSYLSRTAGQQNYYEVSEPASTVADTGMQNAVGSTGLSQYHNNMQPYLTVRYYIATEGVWPSRP